MEVVHRELLGLVQDNHRASQVVQFSATAGTISEERLVELHGRGHDKGRVPILRCEPTGRALSADIESAVVLNHRIRYAGQRRKNPAEHSCILLDYAGEGDDVNDSLEAMDLRVPQRKGQRG